MSRAIEALRPNVRSDAWQLGWDAHRDGQPRTPTPCPFTSAEVHRAAVFVVQWWGGWDARHRLSVIESSGSGRLAG